VPELEYILLGDYVRQDAGATHIMGAGIDTFYVPEGRLPTVVPVGIVARITFSSRDEAGADHDIRLVFQRPGEDLLTISQRFQTPAPAPGVPEHWRTALTLTFRIGLPIPGHGDDYRLWVSVNDDPLQARFLDVRAVAPPN
jgi:hypothetical protein